jgi:hypothetical protein
MNEQPYTDEELAARKALKGWAPPGDLKRLYATIAALEAELAEARTELVGAAAAVMTVKAERDALARVLRKIRAVVHPDRAETEKMIDEVLGRKC